MKYAIPAAKDLTTHNPAKHDELVARAKDGPPLVFLGDSITEGWRKVPDLWLEKFGRFGAENFGIGGDIVQGLRWRIRQGEINPATPPQGVVILIGTNNLKFNAPVEIAAEIRKLTGEIHERAPAAKLLLLGILPRESAANVEFPQAIRETNAMLATLHDDVRIFFSDLKKHFLRPDGSLNCELLPDGCHLSAQGYEAFAAGLAPLVVELMGPGIEPMHLPFLPCVSAWRVSDLLPVLTPLGQLSCPEAGSIKKHYPYGFVDERACWENHPGQMHFTAYLNLEEPMQLEFLMGYDGPFRLWIDGNSFFDDLEGTNPCYPDQSSKIAGLSAGRCRITVAMDTNQGRAYGFFLRFRRKDLTTAQVRSGNYPRPLYSR